jgi:uncharacterized membrane protein
MRIEETVTVKASRATLWKRVGDPASYPRFLTGVTRCEPEDRGRPRRGAHYSIRMQVGAAQVGGVIELVEYDKEHELAWVGVTGIEQRGRWRLRDVDGGTEVMLRLIVTVPGGIWGALADALAAGIVRGHVRQGLENLGRAATPTRKPRPRPARRAG